MIHSNCFIVSHEVKEGTDMRSLPGVYAIIDQFSSLSYACTWAQESYPHWVVCTDWKLISSFPSVHVFGFLFRFLLQFKPLPAIYSSFLRRLTAELLNKDPQQRPAYALHILSSFLWYTHPTLQWTTEQSIHSASETRVFHQLWPGEGLEAGVLFPCPSWYCCCFCHW